jgi:uncharacterized protein YceH (UPF0502 family)
VHFAELTAPERRVLGCLIEKRWTTPEQYPLSLNALRLACNQTTNRDPVTDYDEHTVREAAQRLSKYGLARLASGQGSRAIKYRHLAEESLGLGREELALLAVLLLRGPQTPGELKARSERMARLETLADIERVVEQLSERGYVRRLERRPGQKEDRFEQLLGGNGEPPFGEVPRRDAEHDAAHTGGVPLDPGQARDLELDSDRQADARLDPVHRDGIAREPALADGRDLTARVAALEQQVAALRAELASLRAQQRAAQ